MNHKKIVLAIIFILGFVCGFFVNKLTILNNREKDCEYEFIRGNYVNETNVDLYINLRLEDNELEYYNGNKYIASSNYNIINNKIILCDLESLGNCILICEPNNSLLIIYENNDKYICDKYVYRGREFVKFEHLE